MENRLFVCVLGGGGDFYAIHKIDLYSALTELTGLAGTTTLVDHWFNRFHKTWSARKITT